MKRLLKIAGVDALQSFLPVLLWALLPLFTGDPIWAEGYIVTYPYQFVGLILYNILFKSQVKLDMDESGKPGDRTKTGIVLYGMSWIVLMTVSFLGWNQVQTLFGLNAEHKEVFWLSLPSLGLSYIIIAVVSKKQYEGKNGLSMTVSWYLTEILGCFLLTRLGLPIILCLLPMTLFCAVTVVHETGRFRPRFNIKGIKFVTVHLVSSSGMFVVYLFGLRNLCTDPAMLAAYNMMSMCSDTQWDIVEGAIDKHTTIGISEGSWKERNALLQGLLFGLLLLSTTISCVLICSLIPVYRETIDFKLVWMLVIIEDLWFMIDGVSNAMEAWMAFERPSRIQPFLMVFVYVIRTSLTITCPSIWAVSIAMACAEGFYIISTVVLYLIKRRGHVSLPV